MISDAKSYEIKFSSVQLNGAA